MTDSETPKNDAEPPEESVEEAQTEEMDAAAESTAEAPAPSQDEEIAKLKAEVAEMRDKALRAVAEAENVRRRADKERADSLKYASAGLAKELLGGVDNLRRAIESVPEDQVEEGSPIKGLVVGVEMTEKMILDAFEKSGIVKLDPVDEKFDHSAHQAIQKVPGTGKPAGTVVQVLQSGYRLHDRLLRPAMVIVAEGDATPPPPPEDTDKVDTTA